REVAVARCLVVPQWQGSPAARAMLLVDGAQAIAGDLPRTATTVLDLPAEAGDALGTGVQRLSSLRRIHTLVHDALDPAGAAHDEPTIVIGGDYGVSVAAIGAVADEDLAVVWF